MAAKKRGKNFGRIFLQPAVFHRGGDHFLPVLYVGVNIFGGPDGTARLR